MDANRVGQRPPFDWLTPGRFGLFITGLLLATFPKVLLGWETFYYRDYAVWGYPYAFYQHESFWRGELPLWNGLSNLGAPLLAQWGPMTLYPFSLIYLVFPLPWSLTYFCFAHVLLGSFGMYFLCWRWSGSRAGAALAGTAYLFNGLAFSCLIWPSYLVALGWLPWVVLTAQRSWAEGGGRSVVTAAVVAALQLLAGAPEIAVMTWLFVGSLWIHSVISHWRSARLDTKAAGATSSESGRRLLQSRTLRESGYARLLWVIVLAGGLAAAQLLPFCDLLLHSNRDASFSDSKWAMPAWGWANFFVPLFHCFKTFQGPFLQQTQAFFSSYYLGVGILMLAVWAVWKCSDSRIWLMAGFCVLMSLLALGENGFLYPLVAKLFPPIRIARYPVKFLLLWEFVVPLIAGLALSRMERTDRQAWPNLRSLAIVFSVGAMLIGATLVVAKWYPFDYDPWPLTLNNGLWRLAFLGAFGTGMVLFIRSKSAKGRTVSLALILLTIYGDTLTHTAWQNPSVPSHVLAGGLWQAQPDAPPAPKYGESRAFVTPQAAQELMASRIPNPTDDMLGQRLGLWSNLHLLDGIPKVTGATILQTPQQKRLEKLLYQQTNGLPLGFLDFAGVSYMTARNVTEWERRTNYCALISGGQKPVFADDDTVFTKLMETSFDPRQTLFLPEELRQTVSVTNSTKVEISEPSFSMHRVAFRATAAEPAICVIAQTFYHCWKPSIDGKPVKLLRANAAFQAVVVPAGTHEIVLIYRDYAFWAGTAISVISIVVCAVLWRVRRTRPVAARLASGEEELEASPDLVEIGTK